MAEERVACWGKGPTSNVEAHYFAQNHNDFFLILIECALGQHFLCQTLATDNHSLFDVICGISIDAGNQGNHICDIYVLMPE
jgi:hypothetical protein